MFKNETDEQIIGSLMIQLTDSQSS